MMQLLYIKSALWLLSLLAVVCAQTVRSVRGANDNSCNVVNVHFSGSDESVDESAGANAGPPGKRGPGGPPGIAGQKGMKGEEGERGPSVNLVSLKSEIVSILGARNCSQLRDDHGITTAGYYLMRSNYYGGNQASYVYCDFKQYTGVSTCAHLTSNYNITTYGYYLLGRSTRFQYCPDVYTCHQLVHRDGITESGFYQVGAPDDQYPVYCNLSPGFATTEIWHDSMVEKEAAGCENPGCYSHQPHYAISLDKIVKTVNNSWECQQFIKFRCLLAVLVYDIGNPRGYWLSRGGEKMEYWGGASSKRPGYCACGEAGICDNKSKKCNCDKNSAPMTTDEGYLTDKIKLPVSEIRLGDMGAANEKGWHTLGKLECFGTSER